MPSIIDRCKSTIEFGDDYADNSCTFHCQLPIGHSGKHQEKGNMNGEQDFVLEWEGEPSEDETPALDELLMNPIEDYTEEQTEDV